MDSAAGDAGSSTVKFLMRIYIVLGVSLVIVMVLVTALGWWLASGAWKVK